MVSPICHLYEASACNQSSVHFLSRSKSTFLGTNISLDSDHSVLPGFLYVLQCLFAGLLVLRTITLLGFLCRRNSASFHLLFENMQ